MCNTIAVNICCYYYYHQITPQLKCPSLFSPLGKILITELFCDSHKAPVFLTTLVGYDSTFKVLLLLPRHRLVHTLVCGIP